MKLLAIDTSTEACSAALMIGDTIEERFAIAPQRHAELILPMLDELLRNVGLGIGDLDGLAFARGPGAFTGLRIGAGVTQGIAFGAELPVAPVSTLAAMAQRAYRLTGHTQVIAAIDARMGEVYWGVYQLDDDGIMRPVVDECVRPPDRAPLPASGQWLGIGTGWIGHAESLRQRVGERLLDIVPDPYPYAREVAVLGLDMFRRNQAVTAELALPVYLRDQVARPSS
jgi:tRNA threonylcarbamoyladenosine biosynthesis protein TsaB